MLVKVKGSHIMKDPTVFFSGMITEKKTEGEEEAATVAPAMTVGLTNTLRRVPTTRP